MPHHFTSLARLPQLVVLLALAACTTWHTQSSPSPATVNSLQAGKVRIVRWSGQVDTLYAATVSSDSIIGSHNVAGAHSRAAVALLDIARLEWPTTNGGKTFALVAGSTAAILGLLGLSATLFATP